MTVKDWIEEIVMRDNKIKWLQAEQAAILCAIEELSIGVGLPKIIIAVTEKGEIAIESSRLKGLMDAVRKHIESCAPFGRKALDAVYEVERLRTQLEECKTRLDTTPDGD